MPITPEDLAKQDSDGDYTPPRPEWPCKTCEKNDNKSDCGCTAKKLWYAFIAAERRAQKAETEVERLQQENDVMRINLMSIQGFCQGPDNRKRASLYFYGLGTLDYLCSLASGALGKEEING